MRSAQIYMKSERWKKKDEIVARILESNDVDQVIWSDFQNGLVDGDDATFHVCTKDRGSLTFRLSHDNECMGRDVHGNAWEWEGELSAVDATLLDRNLLHYNDYPNALQRVANGMAKATGNLWVTARLGKEFCLPGIHCNERGSHGSLHKLDSTSPLFAIGLPDDFVLTDHPRIIDLAPIALQLLNVKPDCLTV